MQQASPVQADISAILTTYQRPHLAKRALESIFAQSYPPTQIIIVEDGGDTSLADWITGLTRDDIEYVRHDQNRGLAAARNTGLRMARYPLVAYLDDDDQWLPTRLEEQMKIWQALPSGSVASVAAIQVGCKILNERGQSMGSSMPTNRGLLRDSIMANGAGTPSSSFLFNRSALLSIDGFDESLISSIDHDIWMKFAVAGYSSECVQKPLVIVHKDARQTMMSNTSQRIAGVEQYVNKWRPTYEEWFGGENGRIYASRYAIRVISRLAGEKLGGLRIRDGILATGAVLRWTGGKPALLSFATSCLVRSTLIPIIQKLRAATTKTLTHSDA